MPYADAMKRRYTPDFQADGSLPQWVPGMSDEGSGPDMGAIGGAFKKRLMGGGGAPDGSLPYEGNGMPVDAATGVNKGTAMSYPPSLPPEPVRGPMMKLRGDPDLMKSGGGAGAGGAMKSLG